MKALCICDYGINEKVLPEIGQLRELGLDVTFFFNYLQDTVDKMMESMHKTEIEGPKGYPYPKELMELVKDVDIIISHGTPLPAELIDAAPNLKMVGIMQGGCNNAAVKHMLEKGIVVTNAAWRSSNAVADATLGMMLAEMKNIARSHHGMKCGQWPKHFPNDGNVHNLATRTVGIIGFGNIGQRVAQRVKSFEAKIIVHDPYMPDDVIREMGYEPVSKETLFREADVVTIHLRHSELTEGFIGKEELGLMKPTAILVNTARARLIDENALVEALQKQQIQGAALDVFFDEPLPQNHPLLQLDNVTLTSHIAGSSEDTMVESFRIVFEDLKRYLNGEQPRSLLRPMN